MVKSYVNDLLPIVSFCYGAVTVDSCPIGGAELSTNGTGNLLFFRRRYYGQKRAAVDEPSYVVARVPYVKKVSFLAGDGVHVRRPA